MFFFLATRRFFLHFIISGSHHIITGIIIVLSAITRVDFCLPLNVDLWNVIKCYTTYVWISTNIPKECLRKVKKQTVNFM